VGQTLKAIAYDNAAQKIDSPVTSGLYSAQSKAGLPVATPPGGQYDNGTYPKAVVLTTPTLGATIRWTINDGNVDNGTSGTPPVNVTVNVNDVLRSKSQKVGMLDSDIKTDTYTATTQTVAEPSLSPDGGDFTQTSVLVTLLCTTEAATITYTVSDAGTEPPDPTHDDVHHNSGDQFVLTLGHKIVKVLAFRADMNDSPIHRVEFDHDPGP
jgi:hypothetical protein